jgi:hypothetical protein
MDALRSRQRFRIPPAVEWLLAAGFLVSLAAAGTLVVRQLQAESPAPDPTPVVRPFTTTVPPSVPARAVSVPMLPFQDGKEVRVGDSLTAVAATLGRAAENGRQEVDRGRFGERLTRFYEYGGARFILVFEPFEAQSDARLAAIYLP